MTDRVQAEVPGAAADPPVVGRGDFPADFDKSVSRSEQAVDPSIWFVSPAKPCLIRWSRDEAAQIESSGEASGWAVEYLQPPSKYPELAADLHNVVFAKPSGRKHSKH